MKKTQHHRKVCTCTCKELSSEWIQFRTSLRDSKVRSTYNDSKVNCSNNKINVFPLLPKRLPIERFED